MFSFTMTAPATPGTYTTDWRMVHDGLEWFGGQLVKQVQVGGADIISVNLGTNNVNDRMTCPSVGDGDNTPASMGGVDCRRNSNSGDDYYFYFAIDDGWAYQGSKPNVYIKITYYDSGTGPFTLQYDAASEVYKSGGSFNRTNTNTWKTYTWHVTDAYFGNRQNNGCDFRVFGGVGVYFYLDLVQVSTSSI
jgi:hypothetical protein